MRQTLDSFEEAFHEEIEADRVRRERLRRAAAKRAKRRRFEAERHRGTQRFVVLWLSLIATAVIVTVVMFRTLYLVMG